MDLSGSSHAALGHASPIVCHLGTLGIAVPQHNDQLGLSANLLYGFGQFNLEIRASTVAQYFEHLVSTWHSEGRDRERTQLMSSANRSSCWCYRLILERTGTKASQISHPISASLLGSSSYFLQIKSSKSVYLIRGYTTR